MLTSSSGPNKVTSTIVTHLTICTFSGRYYGQSFRFRIRFFLNIYVHVFERLVSSFYYFTVRISLTQPERLYNIRLYTCKCSIVITVIFKKTLYNENNSRKYINIYIYINTIKVWVPYTQKYVHINISAIVILKLSARNVNFPYILSPLWRIVFCCSVFLVRKHISYRN